MYLHTASFTIYPSPVTLDHITSSSLYQLSGFVSSLHHLFRVQSDGSFHCSGADSLFVPVGWIIIVLFVGSIPALFFGIMYKFAEKLIFRTVYASFLPGLRLLMASLHCHLARLLRLSLCLPILLRTVLLLGSLGR